jgi:23S rRNA (adenine2503-C2)-methyltransferase
MATAPAPLDFELPVPRVGDERVDLLSLDDAGLAALMTRLGEKAFRARQLFAWLHDKRVTSIAAMTDLSAALRQRLEAEAAIRRPTVDDVRIAADGTRKYQLLTFDGHVIESVWIPHASGPGRHALCISSQVGCAMGCRFCATASLKLTRHLSPGEIVGQVYAVLDELAANQPQDPALPSSKMKHRYDSGDDDDVIVDDVIDADDGGSDGVDGSDRGDVGDRGDSRPGRPKRRIHNIVYMGMGEPLHNLDGVIGSVALLTHGQGLGMSPRRLTVSTSGVVSALPRLGAETSVHLAVSLNHTTDEGRAAIMPVNKRWDLETLLTACLDFPADRRRRITFEYVLLKDINDTDDEAGRHRDRHPRRRLLLGHGGDPHEGARHHRHRGRLYRRLARQPEVRRHPRQQVRARRGHQGRL